MAGKVFDSVFSEGDGGAVKDGYILSGSGRSCLSF